ncbi:MAG: hypothetical protein M3Y27_23940 [Acidobacteriota bacterium]|nr:hypothetical protein [Acidobacteriota bacterium]
MKHPERVEDYLEHIAQAIERAAEYIERLDSVSAFQQSQREQDAVIRNRNHWRGSQQNSEASAGICRRPS